jgi:hypothetical protein
MILELISFISLGNIKFNTTIPEIEKILGPVTDSFYRNEFSTMPTFFL